VVRICVTLLLMVLPSAAAPASVLVIGHRGASGHRPEHTLESYRLAARMGADFIEPDLVPTRDGVLIARHENEIGSTTDVAERFPDRRRTRAVDGQTVTGWFTEDFTLAEIRTLRARERLAFRSHAYDGRFEVPTFDEVIDLAQALGRELGRPIGVYPETKHPAYFRGIGLPLEDRLVDALQRHGWDRTCAPVCIQSFERSSLECLRPKTTAKLVQLVNDRETVVADSELRAIRGYADAIGPNKRLVIPAAVDGTLKSATDLVARAHAAGLLVHVWTMRSDAQFLAADYQGDPEAEYRDFARLGVDGVFTDYPDAAARVLRRSASQ
jgi:glycerophosphoryl diester phosphodiesterase